MARTQRHLTAERSSCLPPALPPRTCDPKCRRETPPEAPPCSFCLRVRAESVAAFPSAGSCAPASGGLRSPSCLPFGSAPWQTESPCAQLPSSREEYQFFLWDSLPPGFPAVVAG